jgi:light-regulated signal transduction histidine kinase (bacteriophytochrome)
MTQLITKKYHPFFDDQGKKMLDYVTSAINRMTVLIKGLLEFSRIGNTLEIKEIDCRELVSTILLDFDAVLKSVNGVVKVDKLPVVRGNPIELRMLFQNLISNGLKFRRPETNPIIEMFATEGSTHVEFCVKDNGIGIEQIDYERIFLIFQRLHGVEEFEGTGLGLAYCRKIVELHGGKMWIRSKKGVGSSFYFTLAKII